MRTGILIVLLPIALSGGCMHKARINQQLLERELRLQEDCIYKLKWQLEDAQRELDGAREQIDTLKKEADILRDKTGAAVPDFNVPQGILGPTGRPADEAPRLPPAPKLPTVEPGIEVQPGSPSLPESSGVKRQQDAPLAQATLVAPGKNPLRSDISLMDPDVEVDRIVLDSAATGGLNADGKPGDELLSVVIDQRDAAGSPVLAPGDVSIVVIDPAIEGRAARVARWDFESEAVAEHIRQNEDAGVLHFDLPWPKPPQHSDLRLFVRFTTYDGRRLESNLPIEVQPGGRPTRGMAASPAAVASHEEGDEGTNSKVQRSVYEKADTREAGKADQANGQSDAAGQEVQAQPPTWSPNR